MKRFFYYLLLLITGVFFVQCEKKGDTVAKIGSMKITRSQYLSEMVKFYGEKENYQSIDLDRKKNVLNGMIKLKLKIKEAYDLDLEDETEIQNAVEGYRNRLIGNTYYERIIIDRLVPQAEIDEYIQRQGVELKATHILIGHQEANVAKERSREEARQLAGQIAEEIRSGKNFDELVMKYSDDPSLQTTKGVLQYFKWGQMVKPFQEKAWSLKVGEISDPVETQFGFHIIRLDDRREVPNYKPDTSQEGVLRVKRTLFQAKGDSGRMIWEKHYNELKEKYSLELDSLGINEAASIFAEKVKSEKVSAESFTPEQMNLVVARWKGGKITLQSLLDSFSDRLPRVIGRFRQANMLQREVENMASLEIVVRDAEKYDIPDTPEIEKQISNFLDERLAQLVEKREVVEKTEVTDDDVRAYYEANPNKFMKEEEIELWQIFVKDEKLAKTVASKVRAGGDFGALAKKYSEDKISKDKGGYIGFRTANALGTVTQEAFKLGPGKVSGPIKSRTGWAVIKTGKKTEKTVKPFQDSVINQARNNLKNDRIRENRVTWEQNLEKKHKVTIYDDVLNEI